MVEVQFSYLSLNESSNSKRDISSHHSHQTYSLEGVLTSKWNVVGQDLLSKVSGFLDSDEI